MRANSITVVCPACGRSFRIRRSHFEKGEGKFCSKPCAYANRRRLSATDKFWSHVARGADDECWTWTTKLTRGYGYFESERDHWVMAHRFAYELAYGPIPEGLFICHRCDVRSCCNPRHLFAGSQADNMHDMIAKGRHAHGERASWAKLTDENVLAIRQRYAAGGVSQYHLATEYGVGQSLISQIVNGTIWRHLL